MACRDIRSYLAWLRTDYQPRRFNGQTHPLSPKTIRNIWVTLASFFKWATMEFSNPNPMDGIPAPRFQQAPVKAFTKAEVELILKACAYTRDAETTFRRSYTYHRPTARRDRAIILTLLDTGLRAMELCLLKTEDVDLKKGKVEVKHGVRGGAKGGKGRIFHYIDHVWVTQQLRAYFGPYWSTRSGRWQMFSDGSVAIPVTLRIALPGQEPYEITQTGSFGGNQKMMMSDRVASAESRGLVRCVWRLFGLGDEFYEVDPEDMTPEEAWGALKNYVEKNKGDLDEYINILKNMGVTRENLVDNDVFASAL